MFRAVHPHSPLTCPAPLQCRLQRGLHKTSQAPGQSLYSQTFHKADSPLPHWLLPAPHQINHLPHPSIPWLLPNVAHTLPSFQHDLPSSLPYHPCQNQALDSGPPSPPPAAHPIHALLLGQMVKSIPLLNRKVLRDRAASATFVSPPVPVPGPEWAFNEHWMNRFQTCL